MYCKLVKNNKFWTMLIAVGVIFMIFGTASSRNIPEDAHNLNMLMGMFTGLGGAFAAIGTVKLIHYKRTTAEKLKEEEIELNDERNIQVLRIAYTVANTAATFLFVIMAFVFLWLDYRIPAFISIGAFTIQVLVFFLAYIHYNRKM